MTCCQNTHELYFFIVVSVITCRVCAAGRGDIKKNDVFFFFSLWGPIWVDLRNACTRHSSRFLLCVYGVSWDSTPEYQVLPTTTIIY